MATETVGNDRGVGFAVLFGLLGLAGALVAFAAALTHSQVIVAWGFAAAVLAGAILVIGIHLTG
jgi:hypothetical protein